MANKLLIIEDDPSTSRKMSHHYRSQGWDVESASNLNDAKRYLVQEGFNPHVILTDLGLPDGNILDHFEHISAQNDYSEWVFIIESETPSEHLERIDTLAYDYLEQSYEPRRMDLALKRALRASLTTRRLQNFTSSSRALYRIDSYIGSSESVRELNEMLTRLAEVPISSMVITGETGTGKGLIARILHHTGLRKDGPLVELNCAALPRELIESELFGHEAGAFTSAKNRHRGLLEQADGGTLFLDEISELDLDLQSKLLKAIEDKRIRRLGSERELHIDVQMIAAAGCDLESAVVNGDFRDDLYHRLSVFKINVPPLRERKADLIELVPRIIAEYNEKANRCVEIVPDEVWEQLLEYDWPGNIRELRNVIERCIMLSSDSIFPVQWLQLNQSSIEKREKTTSDISDEPVIKIPLDGTMALSEMDSYIIQTALEKNNFNIAETARDLKTTRETLRYRIKKYGLETTA